MEVKFFDEEKEVAALTFTLHRGQVFVTSLPDWQLCKTIRQQDSGLLWEQEMKKTDPQRYKAITTTYGFPFAFGYDFEGRW